MVLSFWGVLGSLFALSCGTSTIDAVVSDDVTAQGGSSFDPPADATCHTPRAGLFVLRGESGCLSRGATTSVFGTPAFAVELATDCASSAAQWELTPGVAGTFSVRNVETNLMLDVRAGSDVPGTAVILYDPNMLDNQRFWLRPRAGGAYELSPRHAPTDCVEARNDASVEIWSCEETRSEHRRFQDFLAQKRREEMVRDSILSQIRTIRDVDSDRYVWPHILNEVAQALPPLTWLINVSNVTPSVQPMVSTDSTAADQPPPPVQIQLTGRTVDIQGYTRFMRQLEDSPWLDNVTAVSANTVVESGRAVTAFVLTATFSRPSPDRIQTVSVAQSVVHRDVGLRCYFGIRTCRRRVNLANAVSPAHSRRRNRHCRSRARSSAFLLRLLLRRCCLWRLALS